MAYKNLVINIARQYGSGGREIGEKLAERLGLAYYDKALIALAAEKSGLDPELFKRQNEQIKSGIGYLLQHISRIGSEDMPMADRLFVATSKTIRDLAYKQSCVIVGRCSNYVLENENKDLLIIDAFVRISDEEQAIGRIMARNNIDRDAALERMKQVSKGRRGYYERYTGRKWGALEDYDICINTARCTIDDAVETLATYIMQCLAFEGLSLEDFRSQLRFLTQLTHAERSLATC